MKCLQGSRKYARCTAQKMFSIKDFFSKCDQSAGNCQNCRFGHIYWRNPQYKTSFFVQWWTSLQQQLKPVNQRLKPFNQRLKPVNYCRKAFHVRHYRSFGYVSEHLTNFTHRSDGKIEISTFCFIKNHAYLRNKVE